MIPKKGNVVVMFSAPWCGPCKTFKPIVKDVVDKHDNVDFVSINVEDEPELVQQYSVRSVPVVLLIKDGDLKESILGTIDPKVLDDNIKTLGE